MSFILLVCWAQRNAKSAMLGRCKKVRAGAANELREKPALNNAHAFPRPSQNSHPRQEEAPERPLTPLMRRKEDDQKRRQEEAAEVASLESQTADLGTTETGKRLVLLRSWCHPCTPWASA